MYVRETSDGLYSPLTYLLYKVLMLKKGMCTKVACMAFQVSGCASGRF